MITTVSGAIYAGMRCRCGKGKLFAGFLTLLPRCEVCGLDYGFADSGDGPAVFIMSRRRNRGRCCAGDGDPVSTSVLGPRGALAAPDPHCHAGAIAADEGIDDCAAAPSQGRREAFRRRRVSTPDRNRFARPRLLGFGAHRARLAALTNARRK